MASKVSLTEAMKQEKLSPLGHALAGALGAVVSNALIYPLDTIKTRIQGSEDDLTEEENSGTKGDPKLALTRKHRRGILVLLLKTWKQEGLAGFFRGFTANMLNTFSMQFAYFFFHTYLRTFTLRRLSQRSRSTTAKSPPQPLTQLSTSAELLLGALAGALAQIFTIPVAVIATRQQLFVSSPNQKSAPSLLETAKEVIDESGVTGLWNGLKPGLVLTVNPAITYGVFERVKGIVLAAEGNENERLSAGKSFVLGMLSKMLATVATYPYIFAKVKLQAKYIPPPTESPSLPSITAPQASTTETSETSASTSYAAIASSEPPHASGEHFASVEDIAANTDETKDKEKETSEAENKLVLQKTGGAVEGYTSAIDVLRKTYGKKGFAGWYQGMQAQVLKAVLSQGILFLLKDQFETYALIIVILARRLIRRQ